MGGPVRGAVIGCGYFARNHLHAWADLAPAVRIVAVCDREPARAAAAAAIVPGATTYADAATMLERERPGFVDVVTTVETHRALVELAAAHGVAVICQKPFARGLDDAEAMVAACAEAGVPLMVHENFRWQAPLLAVEQVLAAGTIGRPFFGRISFRHGFDIYARQPYLATQARLAIEDLGIHLLDLARCFLGEAASIVCRTDRIDPRVVGEDAALMLVDHAGGARSVVDCCFATVAEPDPFPQTLVRIEGALGTVELLEGYRLVVHGRGSRAERDVEPAVPAWGARPGHVIQDSVVAIQRHWLECLARGAEPATSGRDNLRTLALVEAAYAAAASGAPVGLAA